MRILKYIAFVLGGIVALLAAAAIFLVATFDAERMKSEITRVVKENKSRNLAIEGELALSFWPNVGVRLGRTVLSERDSEKEFAALDGVRIAVAVMPLLSKRLVVDEIELQGVRATLVRGKDGRFNFDDLLAKDEDEGGSVRFDIAGVRLVNGQLGYRDEKEARSFALSEVYLTMGRLGNAAQGPLAANFKAVGDKPRLSAAVRVAGQYRYDLDQQQYAVGGLDLELSGEVAGIKGLDAGLSAVRIELKPEQSEVELEKLLVAAKGQVAGEAFDIKIEAPRLIATAAKATGEAINIAVRISGSQRSIDTRLNLAGVQGSTEALQIANFKLDIDARFGESAITGGLAAPLSANLKAQSVELPKFAGQFTVAHPQMPMKSVKLPVNGSLRADALKSTASGELETRFDDTKVHATWQLPRFAPLAVGFDVDVDRIDVDRYFPPGLPQDKTAGAEKPIDLSALKGLDAKGTLRIGWLQVQRVKAANVKLDLRAANGRLDVNPIAANLYQGNLAGSLSLDANGNHLAVRQSLTGISINPLMKDAIDKDLLEGRGNVNLDLATRGGSVAAMKKALGGSARVALKDGAVKGINLAKTFRELKGTVSTRRDAVRQASATDKTDFSEMTASLRIANGVAHNDDLAAKSPFLRLAGEGDIDIANGSMNYLAKASVVGTSAGQEGKELAELRGMTVPVRVTGPFDKLSYNIDLGALATDLAKARIETKLQEQLQQKGQDKLMQQLKGMFGM
jgi:AsmA protein